MKYNSQSKSLDGSPFSVRYSARSWLTRYRGCLGHQCTEERGQVAHSLEWSVRTLEGGTLKISSDTA